MKAITLQRREPLFSKQDEDLAQLRWYFDRYGYAMRSTWNPLAGRKGSEAAHRVVMQRVIGRKLQPGEIIDHRNGNKWDARRENLRITNHQGNIQAKPSRNEFRGTSAGDNNRWIAQVRSNYKTLYLGTFDTREEAARVAAAKRRELGFLEREDVPIAATAIAAPVATRENEANGMTEADMEQPPFQPKQNHA